MIGVLTPFEVNNYGTKLQAYAMQRLVGAYDDVEILSYRPSLIDKLAHKLEKERNRRYSDVSPSTHTDSRVDDGLVAKRRRAINCFDEFLSVGPTMQGSKELRDHAQTFDALVCGSDQIWHPVNLHAHYFMLEFAPKGMNTIALSPSFGMDQLPKRLWRTYARRIARIRHLSIRESTGVDILRRLGFDSAAWTLDPTLMLEEREWASLADAASMQVLQQPYILCYFLGSGPRGRRLASELRTVTGCAIVNLPHFKGYCAYDEELGDTDLYDVTVPDFVRLIQNAAYVCTDSFHASVLSLLFHRRLIDVERHETGSLVSTNNRITSLFARLDSTAPMPRDRRELEEYVGERIDYDILDVSLERERAYTCAYLEDSL